MLLTTVVLYFIFGATSTLLRKVLAREIGEHNRLINTIYYLFFQFPAIIILSLFLPYNFNIDLNNFLFVVFGSIIWPVFTFIAFHANKKIDVGIYSIINNLSPIFTIAIAIPFMHENVESWQFIGIALLIISGVLATASQLHKRRIFGLEGISVSLLSAVILGIAIAYERFMLNRLELGTYIIYGWGAQVIWALILTNKNLSKLPQLFSGKNGSRRTLISWGIARILVSITFIFSLKLSNASIFSAVSNFMTIAVIVAAYIFLKERQHLFSKIIATILGISGLLLIAK